MDRVITDESKRQYTCYAIQCDVNKKVYIGVSYNVKERIYNHFLQLKNGRHSQQLFQADFNKYGPEAFTVFYMEENIPHGEHLNREMAYTLEYKSYDPRYGYNKFSGKVKAAVYGFFKVVRGKPPKPDYCTIDDLFWDSGEKLAKKYANPTD